MGAGSAVWLAALAAAAAAALLVAPPPRWSRPALPGIAPGSAAGAETVASGWLHRRRGLWALLAGAGAWAFVSGPLGLLAAPGVAVAVWVVIGRAEPASTRRRRRQVARDLPHLVALFAATLRAGSAPSDGITQVCAALPGPAADRLAGVAARLSLGLDPAEVWATLADEPALAPLGRAMARAHRTGAPVVAAVERLADELARAGRADAEEAARAVGVRAAIPLGLCLLPAFVLIGIVPLVVALIAGLEL